MRAGADEAGKGPVLGPMVAAAVAVPDPSVLPGGVDDSKRLASGRREDLAATLRADDRVSTGIAVVGVERIDDPATDMNGLTVAAQARALAGALGVGEDGGARDGHGGGGGAAARDGDGDGGGARDGDGVTVVLDAGDVDAARFARRVADRLPGAEASDRGGQGAGGPDGPGADAGVEVVGEHGADARHPVVAAASVLAKVERDRRVAAIAEEYGEVGSGYPSDPTTRAFLAEYVADHGEVPPPARRSWSTCEDLLAAAEQSALDDF